MSEPLSERRQAENEVFFREHNEQVQKGFDEINRIAKEQGDEPFEYDSAMPLKFFCECSDENCIERIEISLDTYNFLHQNTKCFVIIPGHEDERIERVINKKPQCWVVEKHVDPPKTATSLHSTDTDNV